MPSVRRVQPLPIPGAELARLRDTLHPAYGSVLHVQEGQADRVLVVRVPRDEPDMVNDVEEAVEFANPSDLQQASLCLLVGETKTLLVPTQPMRDLMAARVQFDRRQCQILRPQLKPGEHRLFRAPEDPRRLVRLAWRVGRTRVAELDEADLLAAARVLGPLLDRPEYREARSVYLVADKDDVRMDADQLFQDLRTRWTEEAERSRLAQEIVAKEAARKAERVPEPRARVVADAAGVPDLQPLRDARRRIALAPLKRAERHATWEADPSLDALHNEVDRLLGVAPGPVPRVSREFRSLPPREPMPLRSASPSLSGSPAPAAPASPHTSVPAPNPGTLPAPAASPSAAAPAEPLANPLANPLVSPATLPRQLLALQAALVRCGYDVLVRPGGPHGIDLAAERAGDFPNRVIAFCPDSLDPAAAERVLAAARALQVDLALVASPAADAEAKKRFIATKARWVDPGLLETFDL